MIAEFAAGEEHKSSALELAAHETSGSSLPPVERNPDESTTFGEHHYQ
jgi:hypothetical protein